MGALTLSNLTKSFEEKALFSNLSFAFPESGLFLLLGESGSGKTTLLRMIAGFDTAYSGSIDGGGKENVSMAFQEHRLLPSLSALGNVAEVLRAQGMPREGATTAAREALLTVGLDEADLALRPSALSGGMRQRVSLARAFALKRPILLLDEPEKELDAQLKSRLYDIIKRESKERLLIVSTHTPVDLLRIADGTLRIAPQNA